MTTATQKTGSGTAPGHGAAALVDPGWLTEHLYDADVRVVEVDVSRAAYDSWHIDGAVLWNVYSDLKDANYRTVSAAALEQLVARSGIGPDSTVVFYGYAPALGLWLMKLYGHSDVRILDCSRDTWRAGGHPWNTAPSEPPARSYRLGSENRLIQADLAAVQHTIDQPGTALVDVRSSAEYHGDCFWPSGGMEPGGRAGHVPSAVHQPIDGLYNGDGSFRSPAELRSLFSPAVLDGGDELITYCTIGGRATTAWFVLTQLLGRDHVRVYDGSWAEWGRTTDVPVQSSETFRGGTVSFIQIIEFTTTHPEEIQELVEQWSAKTEGKRTVHRATLSADRDRPDSYVQIVEFPSYQEAMINSSLPETGEFAAKLAQLCDGPPAFRNLDVRRADDFS